MRYGVWIKIFMKVGMASALAFTSVVGSSVFGQSSTANILGTITDSTGAVVPDASVTVKNAATGEIRTAQSAANGDYAFPSLQVGTYAVSVKKDGFKSFV